MTFLPPLAKGVLVGGEVEAAGGGVEVEGKESDIEGFLGCFGEVFDSSLE